MHCDIMYYTKNKCMSKKESSEQILQVYRDLTDFFDGIPEEAKKKRSYLLAIIPESDLRNILDDLLIRFRKLEDYEKCKKILSWKKSLTH